MLSVDRRTVGIRSYVDVCENWVSGWLVLYSLVLVLWYWCVAAENAVELQNLSLNIAGYM